MASSQTCSALVIHCSDWRLQSAVTDYLHSRNLAGDHDRISVAGGIKDLVDASEPSDREYLLRQCDASHRHHHISRIILINHTDCEAYGGEEAFVGETHERVRHQNDLQAAARLLNQRYTNITIESLVAVIGTKGHVSLMPI